MWWPSVCWVIYPTVFRNNRIWLHQTILVDIVATMYEDFVVMGITAAVHVDGDDSLITAHRSFIVLTLWNNNQMKFELFSEGEWKLSWWRFLRDFFKLKLYWQMLHEIYSKWRKFQKLEFSRIWKISTFCHFKCEIAYFCHKFFRLLKFWIFNNSDAFSMFR